MSLSERTQTPVSISPPKLRKWAANAVAMLCDPPRAKGQPMAWATRPSISPPAAVVS